MQPAGHILSVNFLFETEGIENEISLATAKAFFDFDVVVVRPHSLARFIKGAVNKRGDENWLDVGSDFDDLVQVVRRKTPEIIQLLEKGGLLVIILDAVDVYKWNPHAYSYTHTGEIEGITNYDFLGNEFWAYVHTGSGTRVSLTDTNEPFAKVLQCSSVRWTAYLDLDLRSLSSFDALRTFASNGPSSFVGAVMPASAGNIVFLPNFEKLHEAEFLAACLEYRLKREGTNPPTWLQSVHLPGEEEANKAIANIEEDIKKVQDNRNSKLKRRQALLEYKKLLYEKGKTHLEPVVRRALDELGFQTSPSEVISGSQFEIDGRTKFGSKPGILEAKGSKNQISFEEFSKFVPKLLEDFRQSGVESKGIFVGNGFCEKLPANRLGETLFSSHVLQAAKTHSVVLVSSVELYWVVCGVLAGEIKDLESIRESILGTSGYIDLRLFCGMSPFPTA